MTPRRWWGMVALGGAVFMFAQAGTVCCTPAERAPVEHALSSALTDENLACLFQNHVPGDNPGLHSWIAASCVIGPAATQAALSLLEMADRLHVVAPDGGGA